MTKLDPEGMSSENILFNFNENTKYMMGISYIPISWYVDENVHN